MREIDGLESVAERCEGSLPINRQEFNIWKYSKHCVSHEKWNVKREEKEHEEDF